ncbi:hypothetical protein BGW36DRAFT_359986 [Talaromyces proteolyticus]|uniref:ATP-grasp domain-containing protein n=1 Tax=Talaromyces proteolyticus TaxID=1131652 RepID=A0AAD4PZ78_9EURO|nr:uncharacterized protein BGW36DRAFT_359986 [Talaromyces proteolyticus]KAH8696127.1 hypothetical protein BGW36DRAFT_359986 [Talaromyces proteolyticus]
MRICIVQSSFEGSNHPTEKYDPLCDPSRYVSPEIHQFEHRFVRKDHEKEDIDRMCDENFDIYFSCLWGGPRDNVAGVDAAFYLETKGVTILTNKAEAMRLHYNKQEFYAKAVAEGLSVPGNEPGRYPKIVKLGDAANSLELSYDSICSSADEVASRVAVVKEHTPDAEIIVQDYIIGPEVSAVVVEMGHAVVALEPVEYIFPKDTPKEAAFLTFDNKFHAIGKGIIKTKIVKDEPRRSRIREAAQHCFKVMGMTNGGGWGRADMRVDSATGKVYVLEMNIFPTLFYPKGAYTSDKMVMKTYPGGHAALFDMLLTTKLIQTRAAAKSHKSVSSFFDTFSSTYDKIWETPTVKMMRGSVTHDFDWSGTVLDLACGSGFLGQAISERGYSSVVTGVDISPRMASSKRIQTYYRQPIYIAPMEEFIMTSDSYDHIACFNGFQYLSPVMLTAVLSRMFMLAKKSVSFEADATPAEHIRAFEQRTGGGALYNSTHAIQRFPVPNGWRKVLEKPMLLFQSPHFNDDVYGCFYRFERIPETEMNGHSDDYL